MKKYILIAVTILLVASGWFFISQNNDEAALKTANTSESEMISDSNDQLSNEDPGEMTTDLAEPEASKAEEKTEEKMADTKVEADVLVKADTQPVITQTPSIQTMLIAGGCFWCVEADAEKLPGVIEAVSGYAEGSSDNPTYKNYAQTGHREVVEVTYDANKVSFQEVIINAIKHMDPTDGAGSFYDRGDYYSPALYYDTAEQKQIIEATIARMDEFGPYDKPLAIEVIARPKFWAAEDYHQDYYKGLSSLKYKYYRNGSGRDAFIQKYWGSNTGPTLP